jgi:hypothetical protein
MCVCVCVEIPQAEFRDFCNRQTNGDFPLFAVPLKYK